MQVEEFNQNEREFRTSVADAVNEQLADRTSGRIRKRQQPQQVAADDVIIVAPSPRILDNGILEIVFFVQSDGSEVINADVLAEAVNETGTTLAAEVCIALNITHTGTWKDK